ncbi:hypothetical protein [Streptomyces sp. SPB074]|uniref:hypothetical protein n=1 Tax=Streptomyces sp. (strain SPB074) TaxID=465543 RepID=UPI00017FEA78|nr:hypothetical protein [Streptomyces sp. SPB074]
MELRFTPPEGARVLKEPMEELDEDYFEPLCKHDKAGVYTCPLTAHEPGDTQHLAFRLRLGEESGDGSVRLRGRDGKEYPADPDPANDTADVTLSGKVPGTSGGGHAAAWWAGGGAVAVLAGALALWARGRRARER